MLNFRFPMYKYLKILLGGFFLVNKSEKKTYILGRFSINKLMVNVKVRYSLFFKKQKWKKANLLLAVSLKSRINRNLFSKSTTLFGL